MSSRLAKSTSKFRPVKPQKKAAAGTPSSSVAPASSGNPTPAPSPAPPSLASATVPSSSRDEANLDAPALATPALATAASRESSLIPQPSSLSLTSRSSTPITLTAPDAPPILKPSALPRPAPTIATPSEPPSIQATRLDVPSVSSSRQGTPISFGPPGSYFASQSWQELESTQVSAPSSMQIPDSQQTIVPTSPNGSQQWPESNISKRKKDITDATIEASAAKKQKHTELTQTETFAEPASYIAPEVPESGQARDSSPDLQSSGPTHALPPLPPGHAESRLEEGQDTGAEQRSQDASALQDGTEAASNSNVVDISETAPIEETTAKGKRKGRATAKPAAGAAKTKKAPAKPRAKGKGRKKLFEGGGAELGSDIDEESVETAIARAIALADSQVAVEREEEAGAEGEDVEAAVEDAVDAPITKKRKAPVKRKAPAKPRVTKKKKAAVTAEDGEEGSEDENNDDSTSGMNISFPWEIRKIRPGYSLSTEDIYAAMGLDPPGSFEFLTAQDGIDIDEPEVEEGEEGDGSHLRDEAMHDDDEQQNGENHHEGNEGENMDDSQDSTPWLPLGPIDPTTTTMKQLAEDTGGRGRMAPRGMTNLGDKITRKQKLRVARERMKLRSVLLRQGVRPDAIDRVLDIKMEGLMNNGGVVEFTEGDQLTALAPISSSGNEAHSRIREEEEASRHGSPFASTSRQGPLFRPEENSDDDDEDARSRHFEQDEGRENEAHYDEDEGEEGFGDIMESRYAPQMRFVNGEYVLDESSTQIIRDNTAREAYATVEDHPDGRKINSSTWSKRGKGGRWTLADTDLFYEGLTQFGTDFELISRMFSNRTRRQIKAKFVREEKLDSVRLEEALSGKKKIDINFYERMTKLDFSNGAVPVDPMAKFYEDLPTLSNAVKLESNREPEGEIDLVALLRKKKEDTAGLGPAWDTSRPAGYNGEDGHEAIPEEGEEQYEDEGSQGGEQEVEGEEGHEREMSYRSPSPEQADDEPFDFSGGIQLRVSG